jgi:hypothetical protein
MLHIDQKKLEMYLGLGFEIAKIVLPEDGF